MLNYKDQCNLSHLRMSPMQRQMFRMEGYLQDDQFLWAPSYAFVPDLWNLHQIRHFKKDQCPFPVNWLLKYPPKEFTNFKRSASKNVQFVFTILLTAAMRLCDFNQILFLVKKPIEKKAPSIIYRKINS